MPRFGNRSLAERSTLHEVWKEILDEAILYYDFSILEGHRNEDKQNSYYNTIINGKRITRKKFPESAHNKLPSLGVDVAPYPIDWSNRERFFFLAGIITTIAKNKGYSVIWGGDWDSDRDFEDQNLDDLVHFELVLDESQND